MPSQHDNGDSERDAAGDGPNLEALFAKGNREVRFLQLDLNFNTRQRGSRGGMFVGIAKVIEVNFIPRSRSSFKF